MFIQQVYTNCLSEASYFVSEGGQAIVIDPIRESDAYLKLAQEQNAKITHIFETHFHADFISGHLELAQQTGATIVFGPGAVTGFPIHQAHDGEVFQIGSLQLLVWHTPGHTPESTSFVLRDKNGKNHAVFTGDCLFVGDVGRPDLAVKSTLTMQDLAGMLYDSIHQKILTLADDVVVYPAHGPGSACGKNIGKETFSTIGQQKATNYALQPMDKPTFIQLVTEGILPAPHYFAKAAEINKKGYAPLSQIYTETIRPLSVANVHEGIQKNALVLDVRTPDEFEQAHIPNSINIGLNGQFAIWAGTLLPYDQGIILVAPEGKEQEAVTRLARVGIEKIIGFLSGGFQAWMLENQPIDTISSINPEDFQAYQQKGYVVVDVRKPGEFETNRIQDAQNLHLQELEAHIHEFPTQAPVLLHCAGGYRSMIAASILHRHGIRNFVNVRKGFGALQNLSELACVSGPCPTELKKQALRHA